MRGSSMRRLMRLWLLGLWVFVVAACAASETTDKDLPNADAGDANVTDGGTGGSSADGSPIIDASTCAALTCADLGVDCGQQSDGCGNVIDCGACTSPEYCGGGGPSKCGADPCTKLTCEQLNASCGQQGDGCGGLMDCGTCTAPQTCGGGGVANVCGGVSCTAKACADMGYNCGPVADGCGGLVDCGTCSVAGEICGGGGQPNVCGNTVPPCSKNTCADWGANCGPVSDGCGGLTASCGSCTLPEICGGDGTPSVCGGAPPPCIKKTCADLGANCGVASDGCGGLTANCGSCSGGNCCGCGGTPNVCGGAPTCTPLTCADFPTGTCGQQSDGCGGLTPSCGSCPTGEYCGGGGPNKCGSGSTCINLQCKQVTCPSGTTSISGTVYDPAGLRPLPNVYVYVPNGTPAAFVDGATCDKCNSALSGLPLVTTLTDATGKFKLDNMPVGTDIPVVIQLGKWRRQIKVTTVQCANVVVSATLSRLPRNKSEGDIPKIAISTGGYDTIECLLRKIGISDSEFTNPTGTGRVNLFKGSPATGPNSAPGKYDAAFGGANFPSSTTLWASQASLQKYDVVLLSCEGDTFTSTKPASSLKAMYDYMNVGGRVFASHYHHYWVSANSNGTGSGAWSTLASWIYPSPGMYSSTNSLTVPEKIVMTFPKGNLLADWLVTVGASTTKGNLNVYDAKNSVKSFDQSRVTEWIYAQNTKLYPTLEAIPYATQYMTFNTPVGVSPSNQCGRFIFSDIHVSSGDKGNSFPSECKSTTMSPQEKALEFMFFDLASAVCDEQQPPPTCTPLTCADQGIQCGPAPNGCGGIIASCGTCTSPQVCSTGGKCAGSSCTPTTCAQLGYTCGYWADGCGGSLNCGGCTAPQTCGGAGVPGQCGSGSCTPNTCAGLGYDCGFWADGCGGTLDCGTCTSPQSCGGAGVPGQCGGTGCVKKSCAELGVSCGLSGDGCGGTIDCGPCGGPSCTPLDCGGRCGPQGDGCGGVLQCEACPPGTCVPTTCLKAAAQCGFYPDGCGGSLDCGTCAAGHICSNNKCISIN
jgi:hypothetical protein